MWTVEMFEMKLSLIDSLEMSTVFLDIICSQLLYDI